MRSKPCTYAVKTLYLCGQNLVLMRSKANIKPRNIFTFQPLRLLRLLRLLRKRAFSDIKNKNFINSKFFLSAQTAQSL